ncbi:hypothetical protein SVIOM74S_10191 [Streptomyces violarus]
MVRLQRERGQKFGAVQIVDILLGKRTAKVIQFDHDQLSVFGIGEELTEVEWRGVIRQLLAQGLLAVEGEYGTLVPTEASGEVLRREREVPLRKEPKKPATSRSGASGSSGSGRGERKSRTAAAELPEELLPAFEALRAWRAEQAREQGVPAYVIFHDATLREIATAWPSPVAGSAGSAGWGRRADDVRGRRAGGPRVAGWALRLCSCGRLTLGPRPPGPLPPPPVRTGGAGPPAGDGRGAGARRLDIEPGLRPVTREWRAGPVHNARAAYALTSASESDVAVARAARASGRRGAGSVPGRRPCGHRRWRPRGPWRGRGRPPRGR